MTSVVEQWIKQLPSLSDSDIDNLRAALHDEQICLDDVLVFRAFRRKCLPSDLQENLF